ncbi:MAG: amidase family protein [Truepera sp.]|nr:amidase family protein [Truepera sp.]
MDPTTLSLTELGAAYRAGTLSPTEVTRAYLEVIEPGPVYREVTAERALEQARRADERFEAGQVVGPLQGVPLALKDLMDTAGVVTVAGSKVLAERLPAEEDCLAAARLDVAGAVFLGKTTMPELAYSGVGINPHYGTPENAIEPGRIPGGSSSGSAVAVARRWACAAIGSDTGGSVRIPAAFNGIVGLKTTDGLLPTDGLVPLSTTLDTLGPMARNATDAWSLFLALAARPPTDLAPLERPLKLLVPTTILQEELEPAVEREFSELCDSLVAAGHLLEWRPVPLLAEIPRLYGRYGSLASHEALALYEGMIEESGGAMDPRVTCRIVEFKDRPATEYIRLTLERSRLIREFWQAYSTFDALLGPTVAIVPPPLSELAEERRYFEVNRLCLKNTQLFNFFSGPAVSVPVRERSPIAAMIATAPHREELALQIALEVERLRPLRSGPRRQV